MVQKRLKETMIITVSVYSWGHSVALLRRLLSPPVSLKKTNDTSIYMELGCAKL